MVLFRIFIGYLLVMVVFGPALNYTFYGYFIKPETKDFFKSLFRKE